MPELSTGAKAHHERPDGKGYPNHLMGEFRDPKDDGVGSTEDIVNIKK